MNRNLTKCQLCGEHVGIERKGRKSQLVNLSLDGERLHAKTCPGPLHDNTVKQVTSILEAAERRKPGRPRKRAHCTPGYLRHQIDKTFAFLGGRNVGRFVPPDTVALEDLPAVAPESGGGPWN